MTINLEKELLKSNKQIVTARELLIIKEFEKNVGLVDNDVLKRTGMNENIVEAKTLVDKNTQLLQETRRFKQERVFHISQIEDVCNKYYLRFLPSAYYKGTLDDELGHKMSNFEAAYNVKLHSRKANWRSDDLFNCGNTFIMAPAPEESFELQEKPLDPLMFYKINEEYYYMIHKWGNDLNITRRIYSMFQSSWLSYFATVLTVLTLGFTLSLLVDFHNNAISIFCTIIVLLISFFFALASVSGGASYTAKRKKDDWKSVEKP